MRQGRDLLLMFEALLTRKINDKIFLVLHLYDIDSENATLTERIHHLNPPIRFSR